MFNVLHSHVINCKIKHYVQKNRKEKKNKDSKPIFFNE